MFQQITKGIKISVKTVYNGMAYRENREYYAFSYFITIENKSTSVVQLTQRFWNIFDSLNDPEFVEGNGVVGQTPILEPNDLYNYKSHCFLTSPIGAMSGFYKMTNKETQEEFMVTIPTFQLITTPTLN